MVPVLHKILKREVEKNQTLCLIITPTRELANQIHEILEMMLADIKKFSSLLLIGGSSLKDDIKNFEENGANWIVGTPGKLREFIDGNIDGFTFKNLEYLVMGTIKYEIKKGMYY